MRSESISHNRNVRTRGPFLLDVAVINRFSVHNKIEYGIGIEILPDGYSKGKSKKKLSKTFVFKLPPLRL